MRRSSSLLDHAEALGLYAKHSHDQHDDERRLSAAAAPRGDEEGRSLVEQRALDQRQCHCDGDALAGEVGVDVAQPFVAEVLHRLAHRRFGAFLGPGNSRTHLLSGIMN